jgi:hypothetical protein
MEDVKKEPWENKEKQTNPVKTPGRGWTENFPNIKTLTDPKRGDKKIERHEDYDVAKSGDIEAAQRLVFDFIGGRQEKIIAKLGRKHPGAILVPVHAEERNGKNRIPRMLADYIGELTGLDVDTDIVQSVKVGRTGASREERIMIRPKFDGPVNAGREYILVDDIVTQGGTLNELRQHIEKNGGKVVDMVTLGAGYDRKHDLDSTQIALTEETKTRLKEEIGVKSLCEYLRKGDLYGGNYESLTESEARAILDTWGTDPGRSRRTETGQPENPRTKCEVVKGTGSGTNNLSEPVAYTISTNLSPDNFAELKRGQRAALHFKKDSSAVVGYILESDEKSLKLQINKKPLVFLRDKIMNIEFLAEEAKSLQNPQKREPNSRASERGADLGL